MTDTSGTKIRRLRVGPAIGPVIGLAAVALLALCVEVSAESPAEHGRTLRASAHHQHGNRGPQIPTSPGRPGIRRLGGSRILEARAVHPFSVGFYDCASYGGATVYLRDRHHGRRREIAAGSPPADCP